MGGLCPPVRCVVVSGLAGLGCAIAGGLLGPYLAALTIRVRDGLPVFGGQAWRGVPASRRRRFAVTLVAAGVLGALGARVEPGAAIPAYLWFGAVGTVLAVIDIDCQRLPDRLTLTSYPAGVLLLAAATAAAGDPADLGRAVLAATATFTGFLLLALLSPDSLGLGDVKLAGLLGLFLGFLGWQRLVLGLVTGFMLGAVVAVGLLLGRRVGWHGEFAFGPALLVGALVAVVAGAPLLDAYW